MCCFLRATACGLLDRGALATLPTARSWTNRRDSGSTPTRRGGSLLCGSFETSRDTGWRHIASTALRIGSGGVGQTSAIRLKLGSARAKRWQSATPCCRRCADTSAGHAATSLCDDGCGDGDADSILAASIPQVLFTKGLADFSFLVAADRQRTDCLNCPLLASSGSELPAHICYIAEHWPHLKPHIREAIFTLIDAALVQQEFEGGQS